MLLLAPYGRSAAKTVKIWLICYKWFNASSYWYVLFQGAGSGSFVARCQASDVDAARNSRITYHLVQGADNKFSIDNATGVITTSGTFDSEADPKEYTVQSNKVQSIR